MLSRGAQAERGDEKGASARRAAYPLKSRSLGRSASVSPHPSANNKLGIG